MSMPDSFSEKAGLTELLSDALALYWLRPENGLAVASYCLRGIDLAPGPDQTAADFACGDGVNTFFKCGGRLDFGFDVFGDAVHPASAKEVAEKSIDVFDHGNDAYAPAVSSRPSHRYAAGTDHKETLLAKAAKLGFYDDLILGDLREEPGTDDESLDLAYCNSLYWVTEADAALKHILRKVRPGGRLVFDVMTDRRANLQFGNLTPTMPEAWRALMDRGRQHNNPGLRSERGWDRLFAAEGAAEIVEKRDIFPTAIAIAWTVGLRPLFPALNRMAHAVPPDRRMAIKQEWVETLVELLLPLLAVPEDLVPTGPAVRLQYVLKRL